MAILGIDPSLTHFGWVVMDEHETGKDSMISMGTFKTSTEDGLIVQRLITQREKAKKLIQDYNIQFVSTEAPYYQDTSTEVLFALNQYLHEVFLNMKCFVLYLPPMRLKKLSLPGLNPLDATKHHSVHQAKTELDLHGKRLSEHVADAYHAAKIGSTFYKWFILKELKDNDLTNDERETFCGKYTYKRGIKKGITDYIGIIYKENNQFFDYRKQERNTENIIKEISNAK
jgi:Holliday junction resolvasome RuvABC endonuclease subunit